MRIRLREFPTDEEFAQIYDHPYQHYQWTDHQTRVAETIRVAKIWMQNRDIQSAADLSCGDKSILGGLWIPNKIFGDFIGTGLDYTGKIEDTIQQIDKVDLFVLSETLEHLADPDSVVKAILDKTQYLLLTTPLGEDNDDNPEHIWGWDQDGIKEILEASGFQTVHVKSVIPTWHYIYQMWIVS